MNRTKMWPLLAFSIVVVAVVIFLAAFVVGSSVASTLWQGGVLPALKTEQAARQIGGSLMIIVVAAAISFVLYTKQEPSVTEDNE